MTTAAPAIDFENDAFARSVPYEMFDWLRQNDPVRWYDWPHGKGYWAVTRHDDLVAIHKDTATYSSETGATALEDLAPDAIEARKSMIDTDPPRHTRLRGLVNRGFTPRAVAAYENLLRELTRAILDDALPRGEFDFIEHIAAPLPIQVLCRILGVPPEDNQLLIDWGDRMIGSTDPDDVGHLLRGSRVRPLPPAPVPEPGRGRALEATATASPRPGAPSRATTS